MLEKPDLDDQVILACLRDNYGLFDVVLDFLPVGNDSSAWAYKVQAKDGQAFFLKIKLGRMDESSVTIPRYLKDSGIEQVVAPVLSSAGRLWEPIEPYRAILYPFIEGPTGMQAGLSDAQWIELGAVLKQIHSVRLPPDLLTRLQKESFTPRWAALTRQISAALDQRELADPLQRELAEFWKGRQDEIDKLVDQVEALGKALQSTSTDRVLCHSDIHTANVLLDSARSLFIVDTAMFRILKQVNRRFSVLLAMC